MVYKESKRRLSAAEASEGTIDLSSATSLKIVLFWPPCQIARMIILIGGRLVLKLADKQGLTADGYPLPLPFSNITDFVNQGCKFQSPLVYLHTYFALY